MACQIAPMSACVSRLPTLVPSFSAESRRITNIPAHFMLCLQGFSPPLSLQVCKLCLARSDVGMRSVPATLPPTKSSAQTLGL